LIPSRHEFLNDIDDSNDNENEEDDDLSPMLVKSKEEDYTSSKENAIFSFS
jgi:hypothetical protein